MGSNEVELVERYIAEQKRAADAARIGDKNGALKSLAVCRGIVLGYELYTHDKFANQLEKYQYYTRDDE